MADRLANKIAVITGAAGGIGSEAARLFASEGASVVVADIDQERTAALVAEIQDSGGKALPICADISKSADVDGLFRATRERFGALDVLVNNAFFNIRDVTIADLEEEDWDRTIDVCLKGAYLCTRRAVKMMKERGGGSIITMSSVNALFGVGETAYTAAKGGLISMMRLVAAEYGSWNIRSNVICPGTIGTETCINYWNRFPGGYAKLLGMYPLQRIGTPREVANMALFLASDESSFITGSIQVVDGGLLAGRPLEF